MMVRGVAVSTKLAGFFFGFEMLVLVVVSVAVADQERRAPVAAPFEPKHITNGFSGLAAGFPLAVYLFIGWENSAALAEETDNPRRNVARAVFASIAIMVVTYLLFAYATVTGFDYNGTNLARRDPVHQRRPGHPRAVVLRLPGRTHLDPRRADRRGELAGRLMFNAGREGLLPRFIGEVHPTRRTPVNAIFTFVAISLG
jgi:amino acid transporter